MTIQISFTPEGTAHCLWTEALPLQEIGTLQATGTNQQRLGG